MPAIRELTTGPESLATQDRRPREQRFWPLASAVGFLLTVLGCALFEPQSYTARLSILVTLQNEAMPVFSGPAFGGGPVNKIVGLLKSRRLAEEVERRVRLQSIYGLKVSDDGVDLLVAGLNVNENPREGLVYATLSLPAPPLLRERHSEKREAIRKASADALDAYASALKSYVADSDLDRDAVLLKAATEKVSELRAGYDATVRRLTDLVRTARTGSMQVSTISVQPGQSTSDARLAAVRLQELYGARARLEADIQAAGATMRTTARLQGEQLGSLQTLPAEDPLLTNARAQRNSAQSELDSLQLTLGRENPRVLLARDRLRLAEERLRQQEQALRSGRTTAQVDARAHMDALRTRLATVTGQIADAELGARTSRDYQAEYERLHNDVAVQLEVLKSASSQAAVLSLQMVSAAKRLTVVDPARAGRSASPGASMLLAVSLLVGFLSGAVTALWQRRATAVAMPVQAKIRVIQSTPGRAAVTANGFEENHP